MSGPAGARLAGSGASVRGALVAGFGFGGLADGIVLHQLLQWHNLVTDVETNGTLEGLQRNLFWDGVFHAAAAVVTAAGVLMLWHGRHVAGPVLRRPVRMLTGLALVGWGAFNVVDQVVFHLALDLHDIREGVDDPGVYNWSFFALGLVLAAVGWSLARTADGVGDP